jgi:hypothetical protein
VKFRDGRRGRVTLKQIMLIDARHGKSVDAGLDALITPVS